MNIVALVTDLGDRAMIGDDVRFVRTADALTAALADVDAEVDVVIVDLAVPGAVDVIERVTGRVIAYGAHVDTEPLEAAAARGAEAMPRSRFFRERPWSSR